MSDATSETHETVVPTDVGSGQDDTRFVRGIELDEALADLSPPQSEPQPHPGLTPPDDEIDLPVHVPLQHQRVVHYAASEPGDSSVGHAVPRRVLEELAASEEGTSSPTAGSVGNERRHRTMSREHGRHDDSGRRSRQRSASVTETQTGLQRSASLRRAPQTGIGRGASTVVRSSSKPNLRDTNNKTNKATHGMTKVGARMRTPDVAVKRFPPEVAPVDVPARPHSKAVGKRAPTRFNPVIPPRKNPKDIKEAVRRWYKFDKHGMMTIVNADKYELMEQLGVHTRDLRILDPSLTSSYPSCILSREHALVVNLEFVQVIITTDTTIVLNAENDKVHPFVLELQQRLSSSSTMPAMEDDLHKRQVAMECLDADASQEVSYELKVLEVCLETIANHMSGLVSDLESSAYPALDSLTNRVNASNLERVRRVKNRMVRLNTRVETIRAVLEKYLDDDDDMEDLNLTGKQEVARRELARTQARMEKRAADFARYKAKRTKQLDEDANASISSFSSSSGDSSTEDKSWLSEQVEMLLEPYFMSFDNTWNRIQTLAEYIDDTEDLINITLDSHRNQLIQIDLLLTAATFCVGLVTTVAGIMGMNLNNGNNPDTGPKSIFNLVSILSSVGAVVLMIVFVLFIRWKGLAFN